MSAFEEGVGGRVAVFDGDLLDKMDGPWGRSSGTPELPFLSNLLTS